MYVHIDSSPGGFMKHNAKTVILAICFLISDYRSGTNQLEVHFKKVS